MSSAASETWNRFREETEACSAHLSSELKGSWAALSRLAAAQEQAYRQAAEVQPGQPSLKSLDGILNAHALQLLIEPIETYRRERALRRAVDAFDDWDRTIEGVIRAMPESISVSGPEWIEIAGTAGMTMFSRIGLSWSRKPEGATFRNNLLYGFHRRREKRRAVEGRLLNVNAEAGLDLITPWQSVLQIGLQQMVSGFHPRPNLDADIARYQRRRKRREKTAALAFHELHHWLTDCAGKIANVAPCGRAIPNVDARVEKLSKNYFRSREFWGRQIRAVESDVDLELRLVFAERELASSAHSILQLIQGEHAELLNELNDVIDWLGNWKQSESTSFPVSKTDIAAPAVRFAFWQHSSERALKHVPESIEVPSRLAAQPGWRLAWKSLAPRPVLRAALERQASEGVLEGLEHLARQHQAIVREIERAREVVTYAAETSGASGAGDRQIELEGIENARSLLAFHQEQNRQIPPEVERSFASGLAAASLLAHATLEEGQFGIMRQAVRYGLPGASRKIWRTSARKLQEGAKAAGQLATRLYGESLIWIGWTPAPTARIARVVARSYLSDTLGADFRPERLPRIYERLFRLVPVQDPRFLIGRQQEMAALAEARSLWEKGREAGVLIVGERGSGKTSLLNCALQSTMAGLPVIRGEFSRRLIQPEQMSEFLAGLLRLKPGDIERELNSGRRVLVIEEMERTFLRCVNHYGALRLLLNLISRTSKHTLWILSTNHFAFRLLKASMGLDAPFSHRIHAMAVDRDNLREAILMRHNLSGLRLSLVPPPSDGTYAQRLRKAARVQQDMETEFFEALYRESGGVFRTAFALWQRYVDAAEGGIVYVRFPSTRGHDDVLRSLNDVDLFTLAAIMQHGSLTAQEHSLVFGSDEAASGACLDNLLARELIQPDPNGPGLRVIPEAGQIVRQMLFQKNIG